MQTSRLHTIHVTGVGVRSPFGRGPGTLFDGLCAKSARFAPHRPFVGANLKHAQAAACPDNCLDDTDPLMDRGTRLLLGAVRDALMDGTASPDLSALDIARERVGLFVGTSSAGIGALTARLSDGFVSGDPRYAFGAEQVARALGVEGPVQVVCSVCASGAQAIAEACSWIDDGSIDAAIAAGYDPLEPFVGAGFDALGAAADRPAPFRLGREGLVLGEGAGALLLVREQRGKASHGRVLGWGSASDAFHLTAPHPDGIGAANAMRMALRRAGIEAGAVDVVNAHGTGTLYNDRMEARALSLVLGPRAGDKPVYTVKGTIGHTLGAAGAIEAVTSFVSMRRGIVPPTLTFGDVDPECDVDLVVDARAAAVRCTLSISAGFGGVNCALVLGGPEGH